MEEPDAHSCLCRQEGTILGDVGSLRCVAICSLLQASSAAATHSCITIGCSVASAARSGLIRRALVSRPGYSVSKASTVAMREAQPSSAGSVLLR